MSPTSANFGIKRTASRARLTLCCLLVLAALFFWSATSSAQLRVYCWGNSSSGITNVPAGLTNVRAIAAGYNHCLVLFSNGTMTAWGDNFAGQTNLNLTLTNIVAIAAGAEHNLVLRSNGTVSAFGGFNFYGEQNVPIGLNGVKAIAAGANHNLALRTNGTVVAWGRNGFGQTNVPSGLNGVVAIAAGDTHSMALRSNGVVIAWGDNNSGQTNTPLSLTNATQIAAGYHHNLAVRSNGTVTAWELNVYGESTVPAGLSNVVAICAGYFLSSALRSNGTVVVWGQNFSGATNVPIGLTNVIAIASGWDHVMALTPTPICPPNFPDNFECRQTLAGTNLSFTISNVGATREPAEPQHHSVSTSNSIWFEWLAPAAGGCVFRTTGPNGSGYFKPTVAVYTGNTLASLVKESANSTAANSSGFGPSLARTAFTTVAGQLYYIAVDGLGEGVLTNTLTWSPSPPNDLFSNATAIASTYFATTGSFLGASRESGEPSHDAATFGQTLWWNWTAPTNAPNPVSVRLLADAVSFPPGLRVYTGNVVSNLALVTLNKKTNGMTTDAVFNAIPGTTYRLALAGKANDTDSASSLLGNYQFRLNTRALALTITNLVTGATNGDGSFSFQAQALIQNLGNAASSPLRVVVKAISGVSTVQALNSAPTSLVTNLLTTNVTTALPVGQSVLVQIAGLAPAVDANDLTKQTAYGVYAELQEQPVTNIWFTVDQTLVTYDDWPGAGEVFGPGGGVIRLDPAYGGVTSFSSITNVAIAGATNVLEGHTTNYYGRVNFANGTTQNFTNTIWLTSSFTIATNGIFTAGSMTSNTPVTLGVIYSFAGITSYAFTNVTVLNLPPPTITNLSLFGNAGVVFTLVGVPGRSNVIEAATNLSAPVLWISLTTNAPANGSFTYTNFSRTNFPIRFFRAREK